jgi:hypothetical protein
MLWEFARWIVRHRPGFLQPKDSHCILLVSGKRQQFIYYGLPELVFGGHSSLDARLI